MINSTEASEQKVIVLKLNDKEYSISVKHVTAIEKMLHITRVPNVPAFIKGVTNLRGVIIPIVDLKNRFGIGNADYTDRTRIIIVSYKNMTVGMIVDEANDVLDIPESLIEPCPDVAGAAPPEFIEGVANLEKRLVLLLNLENIVTPLSLRDGMYGA
ncbi:purine-binding chemotaxis protein CheW [Bacillus sp. FJAT-49711]|uniref:chemotaxis protein CheW n=1 Tax=Bacillus sp. FJAT-49711 TaxID=2833585 RepID=UPI001BC8FE83|nr:chemotaxis protein CheW [Bacillus sp. FJAT-49711]MBS4217729.1 purine-binding chemotaxis protein CheW [Bacillus sp. FJAT-49711]